MAVGRALWPSLGNSGMLRITQRGEAGWRTAEKGSGHLPARPQRLSACAAGSSCAGAAGCRVGGCGEEAQQPGGQPPASVHAAQSVQLGATVPGLQCAASASRLPAPAWMSPGSRFHSRCSSGELASSVTACSACTGEHRRLAGWQRRHWHSGRDAAGHERRPASSAARQRCAMRGLNRLGGSNV